LRNGKAVLLHLPKKAARITLQNFAQQLQERPDDLVLSLTGQTTCMVETIDHNKNITLN
jgi:hypothetical protein